MPDIARNLRNVFITTQYMFVVANLPESRLTFLLVGETRKLFEETDKRFKVGSHFARNEDM